MGYHLTLATSLISHLTKLCNGAHKNYLLFRPNLRVTFNRIVFQAPFLKEIVYYLDVMLFEMVHN